MDFFGITVVRTEKLRRMKRYHMNVEENLANVIAEYADENNDLKRKVEEYAEAEKRLQHRIVELERKLKRRG